MKMRMFALVLSLVLLISLVAGCATEQTATDTPQASPAEEVKDNAEEEVEEAVEETEEATTEEVEDDSPLVTIDQLPLSIEVVETENDTEGHITVTNNSEYILSTFQVLMDLPDKEEDYIYQSEGTLLPGETSHIMRNLGQEGMTPASYGYIVLKSDDINDKITVFYEIEGDEYSIRHGGRQYQEIAESDMPITIDQIEYEIIRQEDTSYGKWATYAITNKSDHILRGVYISFHDKTTNQITYLWDSREEGIAPGESHEIQTTGTDDPDDVEAITYAYTAITDEDETFYHYDTKLGKYLIEIFE